MNLRFFTLIFSLLFVTLYAQAQTRTLQLPRIANAKPRNIIFLLTDDHRYDALGFLKGPSFIQTPHLDAMARNGVYMKNAFVTAVDFFPTLCRITGVALPNAAFDGETTQAALTGKPSHRKRAIFWEYGRDAGYVKSGKESDQSQTLALRDGSRKLLMEPNGSRLELYDLRRDPQETHNLAAAQAKRAAAMSRRLRSWHGALPDVRCFFCPTVRLVCRCAQSARESAVTCGLRTPAILESLNGCRFLRRASKAKRI